MFTKLHEHNNSYIATQFVDGYGVVGSDLLSIFLV